MRSCSIPVEPSAGKDHDIEGAARGDSAPVQRVDRIDVLQCGYCQSGQIMSATAASRKDTPNPTDGDIDQAMRGNICRCGTYLRIREGIRKAAELMAKKRAQS